MAQTPPFLLNGCIYLDAKTPCGQDFYGYPVESQIYPTYQNFAGQMTNLSNPQILTDRFAELYGCTNTNGALLKAMESVRFIQSFWCSEVVYYALAGFDGAPAGCQAPRGMPGIRPFGPVLCEEQCSLASKGLINILQSRALCPNPTEEARLRITLYDKYCSDMTSAISRNDVGQGGCIKGTESDLKYCGELNLHDAILFKM
jgi:hypothetical protein